MGERDLSGKVKVLLIGGLSHAGKSTFGLRLAEDLGWRHLSTDQLARHPGRPWRRDGADLPDDVIAHYSSLTAPELVDAVVQHYKQNVWPIVDAIVRSHVNNPYDPRLIFEGSAILPELVIGSQFQYVRSVWLTATDDLITERIRQDSQFDSRTEDEKQLIETFLARTLAFNEMLMSSVKRLSQQSLDANAADTFDALVSACDGSTGER